MGTNQYSLLSNGSYQRMMVREREICTCATWYIQSAAKLWFLRQKSKSNTSANIRCYVYIWNEVCFNRPTNDDDDDDDGEKTWIRWRKVNANRRVSFPVCALVEFIFANRKYFIFIQCTRIHKPKEWWDDDDVRRYWLHFLVQWKLSHGKHVYCFKEKYVDNFHFDVNIMCIIDQWYTTNVRITVNDLCACNSMANGREKRTAKTEKKHIHSIKMKRFTLES